MYHGPSPGRYSQEQADGHPGAAGPAGPVGGQAQIEVLEAAESDETVEHEIVRPEIEAGG